MAVFGLFVFILLISLPSYIKYYFFVEVEEQKPMTSNEFKKKFVSKPNIPLLEEVIDAPAENVFEVDLKNKSSK